MRATSSWWLLLHGIVVVGVVSAVAASYHRGTGFTALIEFSAERHGIEIPAVRNAPHVDEPGAGYDGQFYAQLAADPLLRDPAIDNALDYPAYRARRILFSWTAYALGLGRPAWVLQAYALQNVIAWLLLAWLLLRWFPLGTLRSFVLWTASLLACGLMSSVHSALLDGPSLLLITGAVSLSERGRFWLGSLVLAAAGLARETNLLGATVLLRSLRRSPRAWLKVAAAGVLCVLPLLIWLDYLKPIYGVRWLVAGDNLGTPFGAVKWKVLQTAASLRAHGWTVQTSANVLTLLAFTVQGGYVAWSAAAQWTFKRSPDKTPGGNADAAADSWLPIALAFLALALVADRPVWEGSPGAITRVALPLQLGFNVLARRASWPLIIAGNLGVWPGLWILFHLP